VLACVHMFIDVHFITAWRRVGRQPSALLCWWLLQWHQKYLDRRWSCALTVLLILASAVLTVSQPTNMPRLLISLLSLEKRLNTAGLYMLLVQ